MEVNNFDDQKTTHNPMLFCVEVTYFTQESNLAVCFSCVQLKNWIRPLISCNYICNLTLSIFLKVIQWKVNNTMSQHPHGIRWLLRGLPHFFVWIWVGPGYLMVVTGSTWLLRGLRPTPSCKSPSCKSHIRIFLCEFEWDLVISW